MTGLLGRMARSLGLSHIEVDGVRYSPKPRRDHSIRAEYDVRFASGEMMRIRCTDRRRFADLDPVPRVAPSRLLESRIRPGMRVLDLPCGTGATASWLAAAVGPSGAVIAIDPDGESIRYARRRYPARHLGFEIGSVDDLEGELSGGFDAVLGPAVEHADDDEIRSLTRVLATPGWLLLPIESGEPEKDDERVGRVRSAVGNGGGSIVALLRGRDPSLRAVLVSSVEQADGAGPAT